MDEWIKFLTFSTSFLTGIGTAVVVWFSVPHLRRDKRRQLADWANEATKIHPELKQIKRYAEELTVAALISDSRLTHAQRLTLMNMPDASRLGDRLRAAAPWLRINPNLRCIEWNPDRVRLPMTLQRISGYRRWHFGVFLGLVLFSMSPFLASALFAGATQVSVALLAAQLFTLFLGYSGAFFALMYGRRFDEAVRLMREQTEVQSTDLTLRSVA